MKKYSRRVKRHKLALIVIIIVVAVLSVGFFRGKTLHKALASPTQVAITHGPFVGGVTESEVVIFGRSELENTLVQIDYGLLSDLSDAVRSTASVTTTLASDNTAQIKLTGLLAETTYYFSYVTNNERRLEIYKFKTFPLPTDVRDFSFAVFSDLKLSNLATAPAYQTAKNDNPAFVAQIGDFDHDNPGTNPKPVTISNYWKNTKGVIGVEVPGDPVSLSGPDFANYIGGRCLDCFSLPLAHIWDDHDYGKNDADKNGTFKSIATSAFKHYFPTYTLANPDSGLWHKFRYAQAEVFVLDLRSQRDPNSGADNADKSMLDGNLIANGQKTWLKDGLLASTAKWKFVVSTSVWNPVGTDEKPDSWLSFATEQNELRDFINTNNIKGVIFMSGDIHSAGAIDDGTNSYFPEINVPHTNMMNTGCNNQGLGFCGTWSVGVIDPTRTLGGGYALISVGVDPVTGQDFATLMAKSETGVIRLSHTIFQ